ncbi:DHA2 family efflux MFS transporter permease subunit [Streptomyces lusitanus]|uniref:DHA2 family efflux MFS transporter permease subunit n=1 Tax=Streptomyces lusitanus TaxID=68232 RepID=A0ABU3JV03_9ACTN|nr:DHA2 family efflux MFS transporter permease subunit [Streptomyces lusitanus]
MSSGKTANPWAALSALCIGFFLIMMDTTIVSVAIPDMLADLDADLNRITWVNSVYLLTYAAPLLVTGRLGDHLGRKPMFLGGMAVFTAASLWCGLSGSADMLIAARAVQGVGAALMAPQSMAFITTLFPESRRGAALGVWGAVAGVATVVGPLLGGVLVDAAGWEWIFLLNVPVGIAGLLMTVWLVPGGQPRNRRHFDVLGTLLSGLALLALVFGLQNGQDYDWGVVRGPVTVTGVLVAGAVLLAAFLWWQRNNTREPLLPLSLFGVRNFSAASVAAASIGFSLTGFYLPLTLLLQPVAGLSPREAGLMLVPMAVAGGVAGPLAGTLSDRISGKWVILAGFLVFAAGLGMLAAVSEPDVEPWLLAVALFVCGTGSGSAFAPLANVAMREAPPALLGAASGAYNSIRQVGCVVGSAAASVLLQARLSASGHASAEGTTAALPTGPGAHAFRDDLAEASTTTLLVLAAVLLAGAVACLAMAPAGRTVTGAPAGSGRNTRDPVTAGGDRGADTSGS